MKLPALVLGMLILGLTLRVPATEARTVSRTGKHGGTHEASGSIDKANHTASRSGQTTTANGNSFSRSGSIGQGSISREKMTSGSKGTVHTSTGASRNGAYRERSVQKH